MNFERHIDMTANQATHVLLLGSTNGIGFELARQLLAQGHRVTISGRDAARVAQALARLRDGVAGVDVAGITLDLREFEPARHALKEMGVVDHLVLCGSSDIAWGPFASLDMAAVERALHMKLGGFLNAVQAVLPRLAEGGSITFVGGTASRAAMPGTVGLAAVNGALEAVTRTLARELAPRRVNLVSPGLTDTEAYAAMPADAKAGLFAGIAAKLPVGRTGVPADIAPAIALVVNNRFMTGAVVDVDGGAHLG
jgi:NAD(P)-dependent dehydrogenase (short-subunit alcohol dehydrogenase family)